MCYLKKIFFLRSGIKECSFSNTKYIILPPNKGFHNFYGVVSELSLHFEIGKRYFRLFGIEIFIVSIFRLGIKSSTFSKHLIWDLTYKCTYNPYVT